MSALTQPRFAVVGHPNKGKSSIVAALAQNDAVAISSRVASAMGIISVSKGSSGPMKCTLILFFP